MNDTDSFLAGSPVSEVLDDSLEQTRVETTRASRSSLARKMAPSVRRIRDWEVNYLPTDAPPQYVLLSHPLLSSTNFFQSSTYVLDGTRRLAPARRFRFGGPPSSACKLEKSAQQRLSVSIHHKA